MAAPAANVELLTGDPRIDGLLQGSAWPFSGGPHTLTYSFSVDDLQPVAWPQSFRNAFVLALNIERFEQFAGGQHAERLFIEGVETFHQSAGIHVAAESVKTGEQRPQWTVNKGCYWTNRHAVKGGHADWV